MSNFDRLDTAANEMENLFAAADSIMSNQTLYANETAYQVDNYVDARSDYLTTHQVLSLLSGTLKPFPAGWYTTPEELLNHRHTCLESEYPTASYDDHDFDYSEFTCLVNRWENLTCWIL